MPVDSVRVILADAGCVGASSNRSGFNCGGEDPLLIRCIDVYGADSARALLRKICFGTNDSPLLSAGRYYARRALARRRTAET